MKLKEAIILATGSGHRFFPFSETRPKHSIHIASKPLLERIVDNLVEIGIKNVTVSIKEGDNYTKFLLRKFEDSDVSINFVEIKESRGSGDSLNKVVSIMDKDLDRAMVIYNDIVTPPETFKKVVELAEKGKDIIILLDKISKVRASDWICGNVRDNELVDIVFHPRRGASHRVGGVFIVNEKVFRYLNYTPKGTKHAPTGVASLDEIFLEESIALMLDDGEEIHFVEPFEFLVDVDKPWHVLEANEKFLDYLSHKHVKSEINEGAQISENSEINGVLIADDDVVIGSNTFIEGFLVVGSGSVIQRCIVKGKTSIGKNSIITDSCKIWNHTSIGNNVRIMHTAEVKGVIMDKVSIMHNSYINGVIGESVDIGAGTVIGDLRFDDLPPRLYTRGRREEENVYMNAAFIGDYSRTGINVSINPGVRIGAKSVIGPGVIVYKDVPSHKILRVKQEVLEDSWGSNKYGF